jgi:hypothetical protein
VLYIAASEVAVSAALVREEEGKQKKESRPALYRKSCAETRYTAIDKAAYAVVTASR